MMSCVMIHLCWEDTCSDRIPERPMTAPCLAYETILSAKSNRGFKSIFAMTTSYFSVPQTTPIPFDFCSSTTPHVLSFMEGAQALTGTRCNCIFSGLMLFRAAFWHADVMAWGSTSIPTDKAAPNCNPDIVTKLDRSSCNKIYIDDTSHGLMNDQEVNCTLEIYQINSKGKTAIC